MDLTKSDMACVFRALDNPAIHDAALEWLALQQRMKHPAGTFDKKKRFYPKMHFECCKGLNQPTNSFPLALMDHARTAVHVAHSHGLSKEVAKIRKIAKLIASHEELKKFDTLRSLRARHVTMTAIKEMQVPCRRPSKSKQPATGSA